MELCIPHITVNSNNVGLGSSACNQDWGCVKEMGALFTKTVGAGELSRADTPLPSGDGAVGSSPVRWGPGSEGPGAARAVGVWVRPLVLQSQPTSRSGGWQRGCNRQISCLCVFATPFYKGKHNLKYDYLVL